MTPASQCDIVGKSTTEGLHMRLRHLITIGCLLAALGLYYAGSKETAALVLLGGAFEIAFWIRLVRGGDKR